MANFKSLAVVAVVALAGCGTVEKTVSGTNSEARVEVVTRWDGLVLYRVMAGDHTVFVAARERSGGVSELATSWNSTRMVGKVAVTSKHGVSTLE